MWSELVRGWNIPYSRYGINTITGIDTSTDSFDPWYRPGIDTEKIGYGPISSSYVFIEVCGSVAVVVAAKLMSLSARNLPAYAPFHLFDARARGVHERRRASPPTN